MKRSYATLSTNLFQRIIEYSVIEISWYIENPEKGHLVINAVVEHDGEISRKIEEHYGVQSENIYYDFLDGIEESGTQVNKHKMCEILKWVLEGFNRDFLKNADMKQESVGN